MRALSQFIAPEVLAGVPSGKTVLPFCLTEVAEVAEAALRCLTLKVGLFILFFFPQPSTPSHLHSLCTAAYSHTERDEILLVAARGAFSFPVDSRITGSTLKLMRGGGHRPAGPPITPALPRINSHFQPAALPDSLRLKRIKCNLGGGV